MKPLLPLVGLLFAASTAFAFAPWPAPRAAARVVLGAAAALGGLLAVGMVAAALFAASRGADGTFALVLFAIFPALGSLLCFAIFQSSRRPPPPR